MGAVVGLVEDQAEVVYMLHTVAPGLVGNWGTDQDHLEKALQRRAAQEKSAYCKTPSPDCRYEPKSACHVKKNSQYKSAVHLDIKRNGTFCASL